MQRQNLTRNWRFHLSKAHASRWDKDDDNQWRVLDLPHDWSIELPRDPQNISGTSGGFFPMGHGWYHKTLTLDESWQGKKVFIEFEGVYMNASCASMKFANSNSFCSIFVYFWASSSSDSADRRSATVAR